MFDKIWAWIDRDLYESRPFSLILVLIPLIPAILAQEFGVPKQIEEWLWWFGAPFAIGWFGYVLWRMVRHAFKTTERTFRFFQAKKEGRELPQACPICLDNLPEFVPPDGRHLYVFRGWVCPTCGAELDERGNQV